MSVEDLIPAWECPYGCGTRIMRHRDAPERGQACPTCYGLLTDEAITAHIQRRADERRKVWEEAARMAEDTANELSLAGSYLEGIMGKGMETFAARLRAKAGNGE